jgi:VWFA-related protein
MVTRSVPGALLAEFSGLQRTAGQAPRAVSGTSEANMRSTTWFRAILLGILIAATGIPPQAFAARARQEEGPQQAPAPVQPEPPKPPTSVPPPQNQQKQAPPPPESSIAVQTNLVNLDVVVTDQDGDILTNLRKQNFRILDDGQPQEITNFAPSEAPITMVILMEFSARFGGYFGYKAQEWSYPLLNALGPKDWVALKTFSMRTHIEADFTQNKQEIAQAINSLFFPDFSESNLFDATLETLDQLRDVHGKKAILILATGFDTFSKHNLDQTLKRLKETDVPIFCVGMGEDLDLYSPGGADVGYLQAKNQLQTFANMTGGYAWFPRFEGEMPDIFNAVAAYLRSQYTLGFTPSTPQDGKFHKLKVEALDDQGNPLMFEDKKGKKKKTIVHAREGYMAVAPAAGD